MMPNIENKEKKRVGEGGKDGEGREKRRERREEYRRRGKGRRGEKGRKDKGLGQKPGLLSPTNHICVILCFSRPLKNSVEGHGKPEGMTIRKKLIFGDFKYRAGDGP